MYLGRTQKDFEDICYLMPNLETLTVAFHPNQSSGGSFLNKNCNKLMQSDLRARYSCLDAEDLKGLKHFLGNLQILVLNVWFESKHQLIKLFTDFAESCKQLKSIYIRARSNEKPPHDWHLSTEISKLFPRVVRVLDRNKYCWNGRSWRIDEFTAVKVGRSSFRRIWLDVLHSVDSFI